MAKKTEYLKAVDLAIESMEREIKTLAFDANLCDLLGEKNPSAVNASERRAKLREAIKVLKGQPRLI